MNDDFDFDGTQSRRSEAPMQVWDILSILVLLLTVCLVGYFVLCRTFGESHPYIYCHAVADATYMDSQPHDCGHTE